MDVCPEKFSSMKDHFEKSAFTCRVLKPLKPRGDAVKKDAAKKKDDIPETEYMPKVEKTSGKIRILF